MFTFAFLEITVLIGGFAYMATVGLQDAKRHEETRKKAQKYVPTWREF